MEPLKLLRAFALVVRGRLQNRIPGRVLNLAMPGSNSEVYPRIAKSFLGCLHIRPDMVVVGLFNDVYVGDITRWLATDRYGQRAMLDGVYVSRATYDKAMNSWWSRLLFNAQVEMRARSTLFNRMFPPRTRLDFALPLVDQQTPENEAIWRERIAAHLAELAAVTALPPSRIVVWIEASAHELNDLVFAAKQGRDPGSHFTKARAFWNGIRDRLIELGYPVVDPQDALQALYIERGVYPYSRSGHYRPEAYEIVAEMISPEISRLLAQPR